MPSILASGVAVRSKALIRVLISIITAARSCPRLVWLAGLAPPDFDSLKSPGAFDDCRRLQTHVVMLWRKAN